MRCRPALDPLAVSTFAEAGEEIACGDPSVTDAERAAAGRETLAERSRALLAANRRRAAASTPLVGCPTTTTCSACGAPVTPPPCVNAWAASRWRCGPRPTSCACCGGARPTRSGWSPGCSRGCGRSTAPTTCGRRPCASAGWTRRSSGSWWRPGGPATTRPARRAQEYLPGHDRRRFDAHLGFVADEVIPWATRHHGAAAGPWVAAGVSNGGAWAVAAAQRRPGVFAAVAAFSVGVVPGRISGRARAAGVRHYLAAGTLGAGFRRVTRQWAERLRRAGLDGRHHEWVGGHDHLWWAQQLPAALGWLLAPP